MSATGLSPTELGVFTTLEICHLLLQTELPAGITAFPVTNTTLGVSFSEMNFLLQSSTGLGKAFVLTKFMKHTPRRMSEVFSMTHGIWILHAECLHEEDCDIEWLPYAEGAPHYIVYIARRRLLLLQPEVSPAESHRI